MIALSARICQVPDRPLGSRNLGPLLRDPWLELNARLNAAVAERGFEDLRPALSVVFQHLRDEGSRVTEIAERAQLTKPTVVYLVNELERLGYVERAPDPEDGRAKLVQLTERGARAQGAAREILAEIEQDCSLLLGRRDFATLHELLRRLHDALWPN